MVLSEQRGGWGDEGSLPLAVYTRTEKGAGGGEGVRDGEREGDWEKEERGREVGREGGREGGREVERERERERERGEALEVIIYCIDLKYFVL